MKAHTHGSKPSVKGDPDELNRCNNSFLKCINKTSMESGLENTQILNAFKMSMGTHQCQITLYIHSSSLEERFFFFHS